MLEIVENKDIDNKTINPGIEEGTISKKERIKYFSLEVPPNINVI